MQFYNPPPFFPHTYTHHFFNFAALFFKILCLFCMYVYLYTYEGFLLLLTSWFQFKKGPRFTYAPPPPPPSPSLSLLLSVDFSSSLYVCLCLSLCLSVSLSLSLSLARSFSHFTNLTIQSIIPKNQTHKHTCSFHTFQKLKLDFIVAR